ncbi:hypothetical protein DV515_00010683 [Chloebia gouldiae]|uniref:Uncharacterized protein n=1 Tax=Chloebia gouldiae TaxID=44316 RepID=A0A3L8S9B2_CHLGU|nr:hypothetical protein DV515_00010683 [Chloebia gouldiae]
MAKWQTKRSSSLITSLFKPCKYFKLCPSTADISMHKPGQLFLPCALDSPVSCCAPVTGWLHFTANEILY